MSPARIKRPPCPKCGYDRGFRSFVHCGAVVSQPAQIDCSRLGACYTDFQSACVCGVNGFGHAHREVIQGREDQSGRGPET
jgi:hypothetical protein